MTTGRRVVDRIDTLADWPATPDARYLLASGATTGATSQAQTLTNGVITGKIYPPANSTNAFGLYRANGTTQDAWYDSTSGRLGIGIIPTAKMHIAGEENILTMGNSLTHLYAAFRPAAGYQALFTFYDGASAKWSFGKQSDNSFLIFDNISLRSAVSVAISGDMALQSGGGRVAVGQTSATSLLDIAASTAAQASLRIRSGTWPTSPNDGDIGNDGNAINIMVNGTNAVNTDGGLSVWMQSSTTARNVGRLLWRYTDKTDATRKSEGAVTAFDGATEYKPVRWAANGAALIGFLGTAPVARPAAYTQTYSTAARTVAAYTTDAESAAYTGIDNLQVGSVYAQLADLNSLRVAYENLRASYDGLIQVVNSIIDDNQAYGLFA